MPRRRIGRCPAATSGATETAGISARAPSDAPRCAALSRAWRSGRRFRRVFANCFRRMTRRRVAESSGNPQGGHPRRTRTRFGNSNWSAAEGASMSRGARGRRRRVGRTADARTTKPVPSRVPPATLPTPVAPTPVPAGPRDEALEEVLASLTIKRRRFLRHYLATGNARQAVRAAGYNCTTPQSETSVAQEILENPSSSMPRRPFWTPRGSPVLGCARSTTSTSLAIRAPTAATVTARCAPSPWRTSTSSRGPPPGRSPSPSGSSMR
jgi:hypothetical protein